MNTRRRYITLAATLLAGAAILTSACGGDDAGDDDSGGGLLAEESLSRTTSGATAAAAAPQAGAESYANSLADSSGKPAGGSGGETAGQETLPFDRKIIFTTAIDLTVPDITASFNEVQRVARVAGGYVEKSNLSVLAGSENTNAQRASVTLRVPASEYDDVLNSLRVLSGGKVTREEAKSNEVTEQYVDLQSRMRNLERSEQQYLTLLGQAKTIQEIMTVNDRLDGVRSQIEQAKGRLNVLDNMTEMATIDVALALALPAKVEEPKTNGGGISSPAEAFTAAIEWSGDALRVLAAVGAVALVGLGWLIPVGAIVLVARRVLRGRRPVVVSPSGESPVAPSI